MDASVLNALILASRTGLLVDGEHLQDEISILCSDKQHALEMLKASGLDRPDSARDALGWVVSRGHLHVTSTKAEVLKRIATTDSDVDYLLRYRSAVAQLRVASAIYDASKVTATGNRIVRCEWSLAATGRIYSKAPNLQCTPTPVRRCILARKGRIFVMVDWAAAELFAIAGLADDRELVHFIQEGGDIHQFTADALQLNGRHLGKLVNLGLLYGMTGKGMAEYTGLSEDECNGYIGRWLDARPKIRDFRTWATANARTNGGVTIGGLNIPIPQSEWEQENDRAVRHAICYLGQGTVAVALHSVLAYGELAPWLRLPLHDGALYEVPFEEGSSGLQDALRMLYAIWGTSCGGFIPRVRIRTGKTWHEATINGDEEAAQE